MGTGLIDDGTETSVITTWMQGLAQLEVLQIIAISPFHPRRR